MKQNKKMARDRTWHHIIYNYYLVVKALFAVTAIGKRFWYDGIRPPQIINAEYIQFDKNFKISLVALLLQRSAKIFNWIEVYRDLLDHGRTLIFFWVNQSLVKFACVFRIVVLLEHPLPSYVNTFTR